MQLSHRPRWMTALLVLAFSVAACASPAASPTPAPTPTPAPGAPTPAPTEVPSPTERVGPPPGQADSFTYATTSSGLGDIAVFAAIDDLNAKGYKISVAELAESELITEGVAQGRFAIGSAANNPALIAMERGAEIKFVVDRNANEWGIIVRAEIQNCEQLVGSRVAIHSPGSVSGAMLRDWIKNTCPDRYPDFSPLIIAGSQNRAAALLADQLDASPVELRDSILLAQEEGGNKFKLLVDFSRGLPKLHATSQYANDSWMKQNPDVVKDFIKAILLQHRRINSEPGYLLSLYQKYLPEEAGEDPALSKVVTDAFIERQLFQVNGGLTADSVEYTALFFGPDGTGNVSTRFTAAQVSDLSYLEAVLEEIGRQ